MKRKICVVTGSRSEYGLLHWLIREIQESPLLKLQLIVTGSHLSPEFGLTYQEIEKDGFRIDDRIEILLSSDSVVGTAKSMGLAVLGFADSLAHLQPDLVVLMGDRYEILAAAQTSMVGNIPIAHVSGGETSVGSTDESIRHAITKMSHLHFVASAPYRDRVIQMGERPESVFNFGEPGLDSMLNFKWWTRKEFEASIDWNLGDLTFLVTYHPLTLSKSSPKAVMTAIFDALDTFPKAKVIFTKPNADSGARAIIRMIDAYADGNPERTRAYTSLGQERYMNAVRQSNVVIGNSSSGLVEVPALKTPAVNIGDRQNGRLKATSVIDCDESREAIVGAVQKALSPEFQKTLPGVVSLYGDGNTAKRIARELETHELGNILFKTFFDLPPIAHSQEKKQ
jgi:UDP-hydrolysing UDP-N-acetyl-D-glucosamine 2-epimerase